MCARAQGRVQAADVDGAAREGQEEGASAAIPAAQRRACVRRDGFGARRPRRRRVRARPAGVAAAEGGVAPGEHGEDAVWAECVRSVWTTNRGWTCYGLTA